MNRHVFDGKIELYYYCSLMLMIYELHKISFNVQQHSVQIFIRIYLKSKMINFIPSESLKTCVFSNV
jgi:hypothetical protein